jgi:hypothetical protein
MVLSGSTANITSGDGTSDGFIMRISETGYVEWYNAIHTSYGYNGEVVTSVIINSATGGTVGSVYAIYFIGGWSALIKVSYSEGKLIFSKTILPPRRSDTNNYLNHI